MHLHKSCTYAPGGAALLLVERNRAARSRSPTTEPITQHPERRPEEVIEARSLSTASSIQ